MTEEAKKMKNAYYREYYRKYRQDHKDKIKEYNARYWENKAKNNNKEVVEK